MEGYQLRIALKDIPAVWRRVLVPAGITFRTLHRVIQFAMGWQDCHLHDFSSDDDPTVCTDNSEAIEEYEYYLKNPEELARVHEVYPRDADEIERQREDRQHPPAVRQAKVCV